MFIRYKHFPSLHHQNEFKRSNEGHFPSKLNSHWSIQTMKCQKALPILIPPNLAECQSYILVVVFLLNKIGFHFNKMTKK